MLNLLAALASTLCTVLPIDWAPFLRFDFLTLDLLTLSFDRRDPGRDILLFASLASRFDILSPREEFRARLPKLREDWRPELDCFASSLLKAF